MENEKPFTIDEAIGGCYHHWHEESYEEQLPCNQVRKTKFRVCCKCKYRSMGFNG